MMGMAGGMMGGGGGSKDKQLPTPMTLPTVGPLAQIDPKTSTSLVDILQRIYGQKNAL